MVLSLGANNALLSAPCGSVAILSVALVGGIARAQTSAVTFSGEQAANNGDFNIGWEFTATQSLTLSALGMYDFNQDGFAGSHFVGLYDATTQALLASVSVTGSDLLVDKFRYASITPLVLNAGQNYVVAANNQIENYALNASSVSYAPGVTFVTGRYISGTTSAYPSTPVAVANGYYGANFRIGTSANNSVPEPGTVALLLPIVVGGIALRRRAAR